jgi:diamine N-acetyltransferase
MEHIVIQKVSPDAVDALRDISIRTFVETFAALNTEENMRKYLTASFSREKLAAELQDVNADFYFATVDNRVVGYLKLNAGPSQTELRDDTAIEIERIYVLKAFHGKKVGQLLYEKALEAARQAQAAYIWLGVWEENQRAIQFYKKNGFVVFDQHIFRLGDDEQTDIMMKLRLA